MWSLLCYCVRARNHFCFLWDVTRDLLFTIHPTIRRYYGINSTNWSARKTCFFTTILANILRLIIQNRFHLLLKVLLHSKFNCKKHIYLPTPKTIAKCKHFGHWSVKLQSKLETLQCLHTQWKKKNFVVGALCKRPTGNGSRCLSRADECCQAEKWGASPGACVARFPRRA